jgi:hypothetical protein
MSNTEPDEEEKICQLIEEYNEDADRERLLNQVFRVCVATINDPLSATAEEDWLGFESDDLILTYDRTLWTLVKSDSDEDWEIDDFDGYNDTISVDLTKEIVPWDKLMAIFCFDSPNELLELLEWNSAFEDRVFTLLGESPEGTLASKLVCDPILSKWMTRFDG